MLRSLVVATVLVVLGLFAQPGIASVPDQTVYAASDYSALAPPGIASAQADEAFIYTMENRQNTAAGYTGAIASAGSSQPLREPRQDFL